MDMCDFRRFRLSSFCCQHILPLPFPRHAMDGLNMFALHAKEIHSPYIYITLSLHKRCHFLFASIHPLWMESLSSLANSNIWFFLFFTFAFWLLHETIYFKALRWAVMNSSSFQRCIQSKWNSKAFVGNRRCADGAKKNFQTQSKK